MTDAPSQRDHMTDEQLSALLDGADAAATSLPAASAAQHLDACGACRRRLAELDAARELVRTPVEPLSDAARAAAVAGVVRRARSGPDRHARREPDRHAPPFVRYERSHRRRAAVVVTVVAGLALALGVSLTLQGSPSSSTLAAPAARPRSLSTTTAPPGRSPQKAASSPASPTTSLRDIGAVSSPAQLRAAVDGLLASEASAGVANGGVTPAPFSVAATNCAGAGRDAVAAGSDMRGVVSARYAGTPAVVYLFGPEVAPANGPGTPTVAVALAVAGCRLLATTAL